MRILIMTIAAAFGLAMATTALADQKKVMADDAAEETVKKEMPVQQPPAKPGSTVETSTKAEDGKDADEKSDADDKPEEGEEKVQR